MNDAFLPSLGTIQRLTRIIGYQNALKIFLKDKYLNFEKALELNVLNDTVDNLTKIRKRKFLWDQDFTNTFIYYNSKTHSKYENKRPDLNALLSIIFDSSLNSTL